MSREIQYSARVKIQGITPLLMHRCGLITMGKKTKIGDTYENEWKETIYLNNEKEFLIIPQMNIISMIQCAAKGQKIGKTVMSRITATGIDIPLEYFEIPLSLEGKKITEEDIEKNNWLFTCAAVVQRNRINRVRACIPAGWMLEWIFDIFDNRISKDVLEGLLIDAGEIAGLCDWRPGAPKPGKFGMFEVISFKVL